MDLKVTDACRNRGKQKRDEDHLEEIDENAANDITSIKGGLYDRMIRAEGIEPNPEGDTANRAQKAKVFKDIDEAKKWLLSEWGQV